VRDVKEERSGTYTPPIVTVLPKHLTLHDRFGYRVSRAALSFTFATVLNNVQQPIPVINA